MTRHQLRLLKPSDEEPVLTPDPALQPSASPLLSTSTLD